MADKINVETLSSVGIVNQNREKELDLGHKKEGRCESGKETF